MSRIAQSSDQAVRGHRGHATSNTTHIMVRRGRPIPSKFAIGIIKTLGYKELRAEAKRCGAPATGNAATIKRHLEAHIKEHGTASEGVLPDSPELRPAQRSASVSDDGRDDAAETACRDRREKVA